MFVEHTEARFESRSIGTVARPGCMVCGAQGIPLYSHLHDRLFGVQGEWSMVRCSNAACALLWLDPMPAPGELGKLYGSYHTHEHIEASAAPLPVRLSEALRRAYCKAQHGGPANRDWGGVAVAQFSRLWPGVRAQWDSSVSYLRFQQHGRVLDIGCGSGTMMRRLAELGWQVEGIDFDAKAVAAARNDGLNVHVGTVEEQNYASDCFDAVVMSHVIEHVPDPRALLQECYRILRPGGQLVSITPNAASWGHQLYGECWRGLEPPRHLHIFTPEAMQGLAADVPFRRAEVSTVVAHAHAILWSSRELQQLGKAGRYEFSLRSGLWGRAMQMAEWIRMTARPDAGEELLFQAWK